MARLLAAAALTAGALACGGCVTQGRLTEGTVPRAYPYDETIVEALDVQIFRRGTSIELVNHTVHSYEDFDLWLNERFVRRVESLPAGRSIRLSLWEFLDEHGEPFRAGGLWAAHLAEPVVKAEVETPDGLIGFVSIPERRR